MTIRIAVDIGGTFTDGIAHRLQDGKIWIAKSLTTPGDPGEAVTTVVQSLLDKAQAIAGEVSEVVHATTLVTNAVIERRGGRTAMVMTSGTADTLSLRREDRYDMYDLDITFTEPLVARENIVEIGARMAADGSEVTAVDDEALKQLVERLKTLNPEAIAICLLHSYADNNHESIIAKAIAQEFPQLSLSISSDVAPEIREYERASTVAANAYVQPLTSAYLSELVSRLGAEGLKVPLRIMTSGGGFTSNTTASQHPVRLLESGPAAGVLSAVATAERAGVTQVLAFDMGGTTAKACVSIDSVPEITNIFEAGRARRFARGSGLPIVTPSIDLIEIGAGGGSIAHANIMGLLNVGPESAGSVPGPSCYGLGGTRPTVTDADLVLGYLAADAFLGGDMKLDVDASRGAMTNLANDLGRDDSDMAFAICNLVNENMAAAARVHIAEKGYDPRGFTIVATGGAGPVHAVEVAKKLGISRVMCSVGVGVGSCLGLLIAPPRVDRAWTRVELTQAIDWQRAESELGRVKAEAIEEFNESETDIDIDSIQWSISADIRYTGQSDAISVPLPMGDLETTVGPVIEDCFAKQYTALYGAELDGIIEVVTWRLVGATIVEPSQFNTTQEHAGKVEPIAMRSIYLPDENQYVEAPVYSRYDLPAGCQLQAPMIIQETESTIVVARQAEVEILPDLTVSITLPRNSTEDLVSGDSA